MAGRASCSSQQVRSDDIRAPIFEMNDPTVFLRYLATFQDLTRPRVPLFRRYFWLGAVAYLILLLVLGSKLAVETLLGAVLISAAALLPWWLWSSGRAKGLPIWPMFTITSLWTYAMPLVSDHPIVALFPPSFHLVAGATIGAALLLGSLTWWHFVREVAVSPTEVRMLPMATGKLVFWAFLLGALAFNIGSNTGTFGSDVQGYTIIRGVVLGIAALAIFLLRLPTRRRLVEQG